MAGRDRHTTKEFEELLKEAESQGWRVSRDKGYFKCRCLCADKHYVRVVLTASSQRTLKNTKASFKRAACWKRKGKQ